MDFDLQTYLQDLKELCAIDSGPGQHEGARAVAAFFEARYQALGLKTECVYDSEAESAPILLVRNSEEDYFDVLFIAHMDTVFPAGTASEQPLTLEEGDQIARGPGCADCKGGCLSIYYLLRKMIEEGRCNFRFCVVMNSDEERGSKHSRPHFEDLARKTRYCFVFEPGRSKGEFVSARKGYSNYKLKCHGVTAHAGVNPDQGASAILELCRWIPQLYALADAEAGTSVNVGHIQGGGHIGQVPDYAECSVQIRYFGKEAEQKCVERFERIEREAYDTRTSMEVILEDKRPAMILNERSEMFLAKLREVGAELSQEVKLTTTGGVSDGNWFSPSAQVAILDGCGPCGGDLHTKNEFIDLRSIRTRQEMMERLLDLLFNQVAGEVSV